MLGTEFCCTPRINDNFEGTPRQAAVLDQAMIALIADLQSKGLLDQTLVVVGTEFGRNPRINDNDGRDEHDQVPTGRGWDKGLGTGAPTATTEHTAAPSRPEPGNERPTH